MSLHYLYTMLLHYTVNPPAVGEQRIVAIIPWQDDVHIHHLSAANSNVMIENKSYNIY